MYPIIVPYYCTPCTPCTLFWGTLLEVSWDISTLGNHILNDRSLPPPHLYTYLRIIDTEGLHSHTYCKTVHTVKNGKIYCFQRFNPTVIHNPAVLS